MAQEQKQPRQSIDGAPTTHHTRRVDEWRFVGVVGEREHGRRKRTSGQPQHRLEGCRGQVLG